MNAILWILLPVVLLICLYFYKQYLQKNSFSKNADLLVDVFLDQKLNGQTKYNGCIIFQLPTYHEQLKEVVITSVKSTDRSMQINNFEKLNFFIVPGKSLESAKRSIGFFVSKSAYKRNSNRTYALLIKGYFTTINNNRIRFMKSANYHMQPFDLSLSTNLKEGNLPTLG